METLSYTIVLEPAEEGGYTVTVPAIPAIITEGETYDEAVAMAKDAIQLYLDTLAEEGRPLPSDTPPRTSTAVRVQVPTPASP